MLKVVAIIGVLLLSMLVIPARAWNENPYDIKEGTKTECTVSAMEETWANVQGRVKSEPNLANAKLYRLTKEQTNVFMDTLVFAAQTEPPFNVDEVLIAQPNIANEEDTFNVLFFFKGCYQGGSLGIPATFLQPILRRAIGDPA